MAERIPQSVTLRVPLQAYLSSDHVTPAPGLTIAITISKNGAAFGNPSGGATNATAIATGSYYVDLSTTDTGTLGPLFVMGTAATMDNIVTIYNVVSANNAGLAALPDSTNIAHSGGAIGRGTVTTGGSVTSIPTSAFTPNGAAANQFAGRVVLFDFDTTTASLQGQAATVSASTNAANPTFTVTALTTAPVSGDKFSLI